MPIGLGHRLAQLGHHAAGRRRAVVPACLRRRPERAHHLIAGLLHPVCPLLGCLALVVGLQPFDRLDHVDHRLARVGHDTDVQAPVLADLARVEVDVHDLRAVGERWLVQREEERQDGRADGDDEIRVGELAL